MRLPFSLGRKHPIRTAFAVLLVLLAGFIYYAAGRLALVPTAWNCDSDPMRSITVLGVDFNVGLEDCYYGLASSETHAVVWASQPGDWRRTRIFDCICEIPTISAVDEHTIQITVPMRYDYSGRNPVPYEHVSLYKPMWRGLNFVHKNRDIEKPPDKSGG